MNHMHPNESAESYETPIPGCLGKVVNLFDLTSGITRNKLITDKPHSDASLLSRSRSDISRMTSPSSEEIKGRMSNSNRTPVKKLIAQEMSNSLDSSHSSPNVVAKLMGLDALPQEQHFHHKKRCHSRNSYSEIPAGYWRQEDDFIHHQGQHKYKDIYEIWQPSSQTTRNEEKMDLVRRKFMEAKRLSTNEKLRQTKEFQEALEVLSSNQDLFLKVLQEPNSLISDHLNEQPLAGTKRITVLKPSKMVKQLSKSPTWEDEGCPQPTRIVVLKPSTGKALTSTPPINGDDQAQEAMEVAKEITQKLRENLAGHRRDETLLSSVFCNGYTGDESSFNKSEAEEVSQLGSPYSCSSSSHAYYSPEHTVCEEAKKRLSERWAMVASNGTTHRTSSTLGEMLALSESRASTSCLNSNTREQETESNRSLMRSKSLPAASGQRLSFEQDFRKTAGLKETLKQMTKSSFRGKITSLFFSRIMKSSKKMIGMSQAYDNPRLDSVENSCPAPSGRLLDQSVTEIQSTNNSRQGLSSKKGALSVSNPAAAINRGDQSSSISAMDNNDSKIIKGTGKQSPLGKSNLIDKSPPIGSIPRMLSQSEPCTVTATSKGGAAEEEQEWLYLIRSLLSSASIQNVTSLDPLLKDKFINQNITEPSHGHRWTHLRSIRHLVYDSVNAALAVVGAMAGPVEDRVWARMKEWMSAGSCEGEEPMWDPFEEDGSCLVAERAARKEVMGKGWDEEVKMEVQSMVNEIEWKLMEEMVQEYVVC